MTSLLLSLLFSPVSASASEAPMPCSYEDSCAPQLAKLVYGYVNSGPLDPVGSPWLGSGECYHSAPGYDSGETHYGAVLFDPKRGSVYMGGAFGVFYRENPYMNWTLEDARRNTPRLYSRSHLLSFYKDHAEADMSTGKAPEKLVKYWVRQGGDTVFLIGQWGTDHFLACAIKRQ